MAKRLPVLGEMDDWPPMEIELSLIAVFYRRLLITYLDHAIQRKVVKYGQRYERVCKEK